MADVKVSGLTELTATAADDLLYIVDDSESSVEKSKKLKFSTIRKDLLIPGTTIRSQFTYKDADEIYVGAGYYDVATKVALWTSQLTTQLSGAAASTAYYLYLDYSEITSLTAITATELIWSTTAPTYSHTYRGWYNGSDRCIFSVITDSSANIREFFHAGDYVCYANQVNDWAYAALTTTFTDMTLTIPGVSRMARITLKPASATGQSGQFLYWRTNGQTGSTGHVAGSSSENHYNSPEITVVTDSSQKIEIKWDTATRYLYGYTHGWFLPVGM